MTNFFDIPDIFGLRSAAQPDPTAQPTAQPLNPLPVSTYTPSCAVAQYTPIVATQQSSGIEQQDDGGWWPVDIPGQVKVRKGKTAQPDDEEELKSFASRDLAGCATKNALRNPEKKTLVSDASASIYGETPPSATTAQPAFFLIKKLPKCSESVKQNRKQDDFSGVYTPWNVDLWVWGASQGLRAAAEIDHPKTPRFAMECLGAILRRRAKVADGWLILQIENNPRDLELVAAYAGPLQQTFPALSGTWQALIRDAASIEALFG